MPKIGAAIAARAAKFAEEDAKFVARKSKQKKIEDNKGVVEIRPTYVLRFRMIEF